MIGADSSSQAGELVSTRLLHVAARLAAGAQPHEEDQHVPGIHVVAVSGVPTELVANAALDVFHSSVPVTELDAFEFLVIDPASSQVLEEGEAEDYRFSDAGTVLYSTPLPQEWGGVNQEEVTMEDSECRTSGERP